MGVDPEESASDNRPIGIWDLFKYSDISLGEVFRQTSQGFSEVRLIAEALDGMDLAFSPPKPIEQHQDS
jgi:hypothetical protein